MCLLDDTGDSCLLVDGHNTYYRLTDIICVIG